MPQNPAQPYNFNGTYGYQVPYNPYMSPTQQEVNPAAMPSPYPQHQQQTAPQTPQHPMVPPMYTEPNNRSNIEKILNLNLGKMATVYLTFENNKEWNAKVFKGLIEEAGRDHLIINDTTTGIRYLLSTVNFDYATFDEPLEYNYPFIGNKMPS